MERVHGRRALARKAIQIIVVIIGIMVGLLILLVGALMAFVWVGSIIACDNDTFQEVYSPDHEHKVVVFQRDCGMTTGFSTQISILDGDATLPRQPGNIFHADGYPDWFNIKVSWEDDSHVVIEHNGKPIPHEAKTAFRGIAIRYVENRAGIMPPRSFMPDELLLPGSYFPPGWTAREMRPLGPEQIKGSHDNHPSMVYDTPTQLVQATHGVTRYDNVEQALQRFQDERDVLLARYSENCAPPGVPLSEALIFKSGYAENYFVGYSATRYDDGLGEPICQMVAQYEEFYIQFWATIGEDGLTYEQFNDLVRIIDENTTQHLEQDNAQ